jgi:hypothetical protein
LFIYILSREKKYLSFGLFVAATLTGRYWAELRTDSACSRCHCLACNLLYKIPLQITDFLEIVGEGSSESEKYNLPSVHFLFYCERLRDLSIVVNQIYALTT